MGTDRNEDALLVVTGEASGDAAAARVVERMGPRTRAFGIGGGALRAAKTELLADVGDLSAIGLGDVARRAGRWVSAWARVREAVCERKPRAALLVDAPEVNVPLARVLKAAGVRVVFYVGPQVWAWRPGRLALLRDRTDVVALVLPFEKPIYDRAGVRAVFVGHPLLDEPAPRSADDVRSSLGAGPDARLVALLPGSRAGEIRRLGPVMIEAARRIAEHSAVPILAPAPGLREHPVFQRARAAGVGILPDGFRARDLLGAASLAIIASGTATLEAALAGVPFVAVYRLGPVSQHLARRLVRVPYVALPSWIAGRRVAPELLGEDAKGEAVADRALALLEPSAADRQKKDLAEVARALGGPGAADRVAALVAELLE